MQDNTDRIATTLQDVVPQEDVMARAVRWLLRVRGPVLIDIEDGEGRHVGPIREEGSSYHAHRRYSKETDTYRLRQDDEEEEREEEEELAQDKRHIRQISDFPNIFELAIPGVTYNPGRTFSWVSLGRHGLYGFRLLGRTAGIVDIYWTGFSETARLTTTFFHAIPITAGDHVSFEYNTVQPSTFTVIFSNSAGSEKKVIAPTAILNPIESLDDTPPTTSITIQENEAHVSAIDNPDGSGVLHTLYTTDVLTFLEGIPPFSALIPPDAKLIMAFSIDRNGNREYPGAVLPVLGLSQTHFVFRATAGDQRVASQQLKIVNRDPVPLTGPLHWTIVKYAISWLHVSPGEGRTPGIVALSINIDGLLPGTYIGSFVVHAPAQNVVFAEQMVEVELLVEAGSASMGAIQ